MKTFLRAVVLAAAIATTQSQAALIYGTGQGSSPGNLDAYWKIVAVPGAWTPPSSPPYSAYVIPSTPGVFIGGGNPQSGYVFGGVTNYWIAPHNSDASLVGDNYNWIVAQTFVVEQAGIYNFNSKARATTSWTSTSMVPSAIISAIRTGLSSPAALRSARAPAASVS